MNYTGHEKHRPNLLTMFMVGLVVVVAAWPAAAQEECQVPLFIKQGGGAGANVMIMADNSGSMNQAVYHSDYDPKADWDGDFENTRTYYVSSVGMREPSDFNWRWPDEPSVLLVNSAGSGFSDNGRYPGNYLNWIYYHANDTQRATLPNYTRIQVLRAVLTSIVSRASQLSFGITVFDYDDGGEILAPIGTEPDDVMAIIDRIRADSWTPLGETMETILDYYKSSGSNAPIKYGCETNFCLVVTDGLPTMDLDVSYYLHDADQDGNDPGNCASIGAPYSESNDCSDHFDDVCYYAAHNDLRSLDDDQVLTTYVVGFNEDAPVLRDGAYNGDGLYYVADNAIELFLSLEFALQDILRRISSGSAVAVVSTETGTDNKLYRGKFMPSDWYGYLECYDLPYEDGDVPVWDAGYLLESRSPGSRSVFTAIDKQEYSFTEGSAVNLRSSFEVDTDEEAIDLINWARGESVSGLRERSGRILGDIIHATPVVVGKPRSFHATEAYQAFADRYETRRRQIYVGANDGMLHAFDAESGYEKWAFVPEFTLPMFTVMADSGYCHRYSCDQTVTAKDILVNGSWRTILATGGGRGGGAIFAMDVTDPDNPEVLWQQTLPNKAAIHSQVQITTIGDHAVALVGSGLEESSTAKAWVWSYDLESGDLLGARELSTVNGRNKATRPEIVDVNLDGWTDMLYTADMAGNLWRIDVNDDPDPDGWDVNPLFVCNREITSDPVAAYGQNGEVMVYFGTGAYLQDADLTTMDQHYFVCAMDNHSGATYDLGDMANQTSSLHTVTDSGWYVELQEADGERVTERAVVVAQEVIFTSYAPSNDVCKAGGESWLYEMRYDDGGVAGDDDNEEDLSDRSSSLGDGVASFPVVDLASGTIVVQSSDATITVDDVDTMYMRLTVRSWQETYDHVQAVTQGEPAGGDQ